MTESADRAGFLKRRCHEIIDTYLCNGAEFPSTLVANNMYDPGSDNKSCHAVAIIGDCELLCEQHACKIWQ